MGLKISAKVKYGGTKYGGDQYLLCIGYYSLLSSFYFISE